MKISGLKNVDFLLLTFWIGPSVQFWPYGILGLLTVTLLRVYGISTVGFQAQIGPEV